MRNLPPPDPDRSQLGLDEWIGIIVAFTTIGTILIGILIQKDKGFDLRRWIALTPDRTTEETPERTPATPLPEETPTPEPQAIAPQIAPSPSPILPASPRLPTEESKRTHRVLPLTPVPLAPSAETPRFADVPAEFWASPYINALVERDIMSGFPDGTFRPNGSISRAEFAALLTKAFEQEPTLQVPNFEDVSNDFWAWSAIQETTKTNFLRGYPDKTFRPRQQIPRVQVLVALASGLGLKATEAAQEVLQKYQDATQVPNYATQKVSAATEAGLVVNYPNPQSLNPNQNATRAEVAALIYQALVQAGKAEAIPSEYVVKP